MQNKIIKTSLVLILLCLSNILKAQCDRINMIIFIDEKISYTICNYKISSQSLGDIYAKYHVGDLLFETADYDKLINDNSEKIIMKFDAWLPNKVFAEIYSFEIPKSFIDEDYIIVNIYNLDKRIYKRKYSKISKNKDYYITISAPNVMIL